MATETETLTRCPYCQTRFRVTPRQIEAARGRVRCGHCLYVFNAVEHAEPEEDTTTESGNTVPLDQSSGAETGEDDLVFDDNPEEDAQEGRYAGHDEPKEEEFSEDFLALDAGDRSGFRSELDDLDSREQLEDDESWAESLLQEIESEPAPAASEPKPPSEPPAPEPPPREQAPDPELELEPTPRQEPRKASSSEPAWQSLSTDPIVASRPDRWRWLRRLAWLLGIAGMVGLLVYQLGWYRFERLALYEPIRPWYEQACDWVGCELPPLVATDALEPRRLVVRSHPDIADALLLEVTIVNEAGFDQPWPAIALSFSNLNNDVVAQRVFQPQDYLADEETERGHVPSREGRRIRLGLQDPGKDAINYRIDFLPARQ
ncbi:DUF3426 domain-containing protein [Vreelandella utahensis]|uniref:DUF3426 domain-containing protein n=1 Tax=Vreelandella halophila TaxID=86177 RepID=UPI0009856D32|nr:DUF3426 domain-containing protein [Halomonas utahensis]